jgi:hypothetical protein
MDEPTHDGYGEIHVFSYKQISVEDHKRKYLKQKMVSIKQASDGPTKAT